MLLGAIKPKWLVINPKGEAAPMDPDVHRDAQARPAPFSQEQPQNDPGDGTKGCSWQSQMKGVDAASLPWQGDEREPCSLLFVDMEIPH